MSAHRPNSASRPLAAIVLAAGKGTRMNSDLPKVVHAACGKPLVRWVVEACREASAAPIALVVGHRADDVKSVFARDGADVRYALQSPQLGTGHAVAQAEPVLTAAEREGDVLVLYGDGPLIRASTLRTLVERHRATGAVATLATAVIPEPTGYGRILRDEHGAFRSIREQKDATPDELLVREINPGYYCFRAAELFAALRRVGTANASGEQYLTDVFDIFRGDGQRIEVVAAVPAEDVLSVNTPQQLAAVEAILRVRANSTDVDAARAAQHA
jgi:UDP-N-acetylglucosamine diphosphorylase/glucosamine-1-phosphate N-acetyltransferase